MAREALAEALELNPKFEAAEDLIKIVEQKLDLD
jgi:hypothetical protein